ncbi:hypothetical protein [Sutcliffiella rhizosphaerae]|uniref:Glycosyltransferase family 2 protein n=1 Tax=Sutcliffiella rhizosphaerae TaxID=2880967 RepID=A0ABN8A9K3_9BACI|nr:hypothetical protein [Sutcliffiella rhizosphaerae]CAG9620657.1 hypothetical protein BACCIP111883_01426 [Sutcliffiella rhizosphaerae]
MKIGLLVVTHDPTGRYINQFKVHKSFLSSLYDDIYLTVSDRSAETWKEELQEAKMVGKIIPKLGVAHARREVVKLGLAGECDFFHYVDLDRLLTWCTAFPEELEKTVTKIPDNPFTILGRTERAFMTHPEDWRETEKITNKICSLVLAKEVDITAGSCSFSRESATYIEKLSKNSMTDAEWPMIIHRIARKKVAYLECEGLEYHSEVNNMTISRPEVENWLGILKLAYIISESAVKTGKELNG